MTKTSEFSWDKETAKSLMDKFEAFWSQNPEQYGITGGADAATGTANARNLFMTMKNHGKTSRKNATFAGAGYIWDDLEEIIEDNLVLEDELKTFEFMLKALKQMEGSDRDPRNIVFNTVVEYDSETGESTRDQVRGHFLTLAYWNFRKDKDSSYNVEKPKPSWVSKKKNDAEPPLWRIIFGRKNSLRTLVQDIYELAKKPTPPPTAHLDLKISSGKAGQLATIPSVQEAVRSVLNESSIYNAGKSRAPNKGRLNDAMAAMVIPSTPEIMRIVAKEATVLVENDGKIIRRKLRDFPGYEDIKSITLNFPRNNIVLNKLIREVMGDDMETFERPGRVEDGPIGLVLKAEPEDLIRYASNIIKEVRFSYEGIGENPPVMGRVRYNMSDMEDADVNIRLGAILTSVVDDDDMDYLTGIASRRAEGMEFTRGGEDYDFDQDLVNQVIETLSHEGVHYAQSTIPEYREVARDLEENYRTLGQLMVNFLAAEDPQEREQNRIYLGQFMEALMDSVMVYYIQKEFPAYYAENNDFNEAIGRVRAGWLHEKPFMERIRKLVTVIETRTPLGVIYNEDTLQRMQNRSDRAFMLRLDRFEQKGESLDENN